MVQNADEHRCRACGSELAEASTLDGIDRLHGTPGGFEVVICNACGSGTTLPVVDEGLLASLYPGGYGAYEPAGAGAVGAISRVIRWYQGRRALYRAPFSTIRGRPPGRLVDVGCGRGDLAAVFVGRGWHATGIEPSASACATARSRGVEARHGTLADITLEPGPMTWPFSTTHSSTPSTRWVT